MSEIGAVDKVVDSHLCRWGSILGKSCSFLIVSLSNGLSLYFMCSDQHVKYLMSHGFPSDYHSADRLPHYTIHTITINTYIYYLLQVSEALAKDDNDLISIEDLETLTRRGHALSLHPDVDKVLAEIDHTLKIGQSWEEKASICLQARLVI